MKNILLVGAVCVGLCGVMMAEDFSKKSNDELVRLHGYIKQPSDAADLKLELKKRIESMDGRAKKEFVEKLKDSYNKNTENMTLRDFRKYEADVKKELKAKMEKLGIKHEMGEHKHGDAIKGHSCGEGCACGHEHSKDSKEGKKGKKDSKDSKDRKDSNR